jgi:hypothetical protein
MRHDPRKLRAVPAANAGGATRGFVGRNTFREVPLTEVESGNSGRFLLFAAVAALASAAIVATAQTPISAQSGAASASSAANIDVDVLKGAWVRPDGGYQIVVKSIGPAGQLEAMYFNPNPLPFAKARALPEGPILRAFFELQAGGYAGSTYELTYDPASDRLKGIYYQAVAKQKFDVFFVRKRVP